MRTEDGPRYPVYSKPPPRTWWLQNPAYRRFAAREATSIFAGAASVLLLLFLFALSRGPEAYEGFLRWLKSPGVIALSAIILVALLYHVATWFNLTSKILLVRLGPLTVPPRLTVVALAAVWAGLSGAVLYFHAWF